MGSHPPAESVGGVQMEALELRKPCGRRFFVKVTPSELNERRLKMDGGEEAGKDGPSWREVVIQEYEPGGGRGKRGEAIGILVGRVRSRRGAFGLRRRGMKPKGGRDLWSKEMSCSIERKEHSGGGRC